MRRVDYIGADPPRPGPADASLWDNSDETHLRCGCRLVRWNHPQGVTLYQCSLHRTAEELQRVAAIIQGNFLDAIERWGNIVIGDDDSEWLVEQLQGVLDSGKEDKEGECREDC